MTPLSPRLLKGGIVQMDPGSGRVLRVIGLQYNPDTLSRTLQLQATGESGDRSEAMRLKGAAVETIKVEIEIDAAERLGDPEANPVTVKLGIQPELAALESLVQPRADALQANDALAGAGVLEVLPLESPLTLFVWSKQRVVPVRVTDISVTEEAFDVGLNPIRAKVSLGLRVMTVDDFPLAHRGAALFLSYLQTKEQLVAKAPGGSFATLGIGGIG